MTGMVLRDTLFDDLFDVRREFDRAFRRLLTATPNGKEQMAPWGAFNFVPAIESYLDKDGKKYVCKVALPGIEPKEVQVSVQGNMLTITGERKLTKETKEVNYLCQEFAYGKFEREFELPEGVNAEKMNAEYVNGVLEVTAPIAAVALPKKIEVKTVPIARPMAA